VKFGAHYLFFNIGEKAKYLSLAPIEVEILLCRGSAQKIAMDSGTNAG
jgi:hypothetical protein